MLASMWPARLGNLETTWEIACTIPGVCPLLKIAVVHTVSFSEASTARCPASLLQHNLNHQYCLRCLVPLHAPRCL
jgi:hypothetical protein